MIDDLLIQMIQGWQQIPAEWASLALFLVSMLTILGACRLGFEGLCTYNVLAVVMGNIQVLRVSHYTFLGDPIALGTVLFVSTFLVTDIITEHYGATQAKQCIFLCFIGQLVVVMWMILCIAHKGDSTPEQNTITQGMILLFVPQCRFFIASLIAFTLSQLADIALYQFFKKTTPYGWLNQNISRFLSGFLDNAIFSLLAWIVFNPTPFPMRTVLITYMLSGYILRALLNLMATPVAYASRHVISPKESL